MTGISEGKKETEKEKRRRPGKRIAFLAWGAGIGVSGTRLCLFYIPCRLEEECRGAGVDAEMIERWEKRAEETGILSVAGWRTEKKAEVVSFGTKRQKEAGIVKVYGAMELVFSARILSGTYGMTGREEACVLSKGLADALFGSVDVAGEKICLREPGKGKRNFIVAGVIDKEGEYLLIHQEEEEADYVAVRFKARFQACQKLQELLQGG